jgi:hypothetical protein
MVDERGYECTIVLLLYCFLPARACNARAGLHSALLLLLLLLWRRMLYSNIANFVMVAQIKSFIANFVMVASRVVVCHVKLSRVNSRRIKIRVALRRVNIIVMSICFDATQIVANIDMLCPAGSLVRPYSCR